MPGILPEMSIEESLEVTRIYSVANQLPPDTRVLEVMGQPMEDKVMTISHENGSLTFSANFQLIAAMNPCQAKSVCLPACSWALLIGSLGMLERR
jgi:predicted ATPase with chaperone activity